MQPIAKSHSVTVRELQIKSIQYRRKVIQYIYQAKAGHTGGSLSCIDILNVLYNRILNVSPDTFHSPDRDRYVQSKGHSVEALYVVLADAGFFPESDLETLCSYRSHYIGHPTKKVHGIEQNTGGLGHGLPICTGMAIAGKKDMKSYRVFTLLGDGELAEGSNWEAAMAASHYRLDNLMAIVDRNRLQISGTTDEVCSSDPLEAKFQAFGWNVKVVDGHNIPELIRILEAPGHDEKPTAIIADTLKGKGISFIEGNIAWHHKVPTEEQLLKAYSELDAQLEQLKND